MGILRFKTEDGTLLQAVDLSTSRALDIPYTADAHYGSFKAPVILLPVSEELEEGLASRVYKLIENDHLIIIRNGERYDVTGVKMPEQH